MPRFHTKSWYDAGGSMQDTPKPMLLGDVLGAKSIPHVKDGSDLSRQTHRLGVLMAQIGEGEDPRAKNSTRRESL